MFTHLHTLAYNIYTNGFVVSSFKYMLRLFGIIMLLIISHWGVVFAYNYFCIPSSPYNIVASMFMMASPVCIAMNKLQLSIAEYYITVITTAAASLMTLMVVSR